MQIVPEVTMLRTIIFFAITVLLCIFGLLTLPIMWVIHFFKPDIYGIWGFAFIRGACWLAIHVIGVKREITGLENLPEKGSAAVYVLNHRSIFDIITTYPMFPDQTGFIAKEELKKIPVFSLFMRLGHCLFLNRDDPRAALATINKGVEYINDGVSMCIFPEGTRNKNSEDLTELLPFHSGSLKLAVKSDAPIIPIALYNTADCFEAHMPKMKPAEVKITIGQPINVKDLVPEEKRHLGNYVQNTLQEMMNTYEK